MSVVSANVLSPAVRGLQYVSYRLECEARSSAESNLCQSVNILIVQAINAANRGEIPEALGHIRQACDSLSTRTLSGILPEIYESLRELDILLNGDSDSSSMFQDLSNWWFKTVHFYRKNMKLAPEGTPSSILTVFLFTFGFIPAGSLMSIFPLPYFLLWSIPVTLIMLAILVFVFMKFPSGAARNRWLAIMGIYTLAPYLVFLMRWSLGLCDEIYMAIPFYVYLVALVMLVGFVLLVLAVPPYLPFLIGNRRAEKYGVYARVWMRKNQSGAYDYALTDSHGQVVWQKKVSRIRHKIEQLSGYGIGPRLSHKNSPAVPLNMWVQCYVMLRATGGYRDDAFLFTGRDLFFRLGRAPSLLGIFYRGNSLVVEVSEKDLREYFSFNLPRCEPLLY